MESSQVQSPDTDTKTNPDESCVLRFLMINGESFRMTFPADTCVEEVKKTITDNPPKELIEFLAEALPNLPESRAKVDDVRILHLGKFLDDEQTLRDYNMATGPDNLTVVHINIRAPQNTTDDMKEKMNKKGNGCCIIM